MASGRFFRTAVNIALAIAIGSAAVADIQAQMGTATITGLVRDSSGATVPGATVRIVGEVNGITREIVTNDQGSYRADALPPGLYRIETTLDGFETPARHVAVEPNQTLALDVTLTPSRLSEAVLVTARRIEEVAQEVPIPVSVISGNTVADAGAFNVNRLKEQLPTVQFYSTNPRNSSVQIRGLGAPFGLTNDGIEPGVGLYIDGVFYARPASATLDFLDVERIEVLRGPQGNLFGKNTTAGAINVTTRKPTFTPETSFELNYGNLGFVQAKASLSGPLAPKLAGRFSFSGTQRDGTVQNTVTRNNVNDLNNLGIRGQLLFAPSDLVAVTLGVDHTRQRPEGYTQVVAGVAPTLRPANRQYPQIAADLGYTPPSFNAFDRLTDVDSPLRSYQDLGGTYSVDRLAARTGPPDIHLRLALLGLEPFERQGLHRPRRNARFGSAFDTDAMDAGDSVRRRRLLARKHRQRRVLLPSAAGLGSVIQAGARGGCGAFSAGAERECVHPRSSRRVRLRPVPEVSQPERRAVRTTRVVGH